MPQGALLAEVRALLRQYGLHPRHALGQNFLVDDEVLDAILAAAELSGADTVLEIGPGVGVLTDRLARRVRHVVAVELDDNLARVVAERFGELGNVTVRHANVLHADLSPDLGGRPFKVVANIPYYITAPILRLFLEGRGGFELARPDVMVLMVQREVAERLTARPGKMSLLSLSAQLFAQPDIVRLVPAAAFYPPPEVQSAIVRLRRRPHDAVDPALLPVVFRVARAAFHDRRKQLHNALTIGLAHLGAERVDVALQRAEIDRRRRAETLSVEEWGRLAAAFAAVGLVAAPVTASIVAAGEESPGG
jgi:16S rRNA (adenine1518-N6/adenine1519-N6)-dimethyltransferase